MPIFIFSKSGTSISFINPVLLIKYDSLLIIVYLSFQTNNEALETLAFNNSLILYKEWLKLSYNLVYILRRQASKCL